MDKNLELRLKNIETTLKYQTKLLEDIFDAVNTKQSRSAEQGQHVKQTLERFLDNKKNATGGNEKILEMFDNMIKEVVPK